MSLDIRPFTPDLIPQAAQLLAARHSRERSLFPGLPAAFSDPAGAESALRSTWERELSAGFAAFEGTRLLAYLIGDRQISPLWGRSAWIRLAGQAADPDTGYEPLKALYARLGELWVQSGCFTHFSVVPAGQTELRQAWHELSFGIEHVHGFQELHPTPVPPLPADFELHSITPAVQDALVQLSDLIWRQQTQAPIWGIHLPEANDAADWAEAAADPELTGWLVTKDQEPVAAMGYFPAADFDDALVIPENSVHLTLAGVKPAYRGSGIGHALTTLALQDALKNGYAHCITNWRSTSLYVSRYWPRQGFVPSAFRLVRRVDERIAWANGRA